MTCDSNVHEVNACGKGRESNLQPSHLKNIPIALGYFIQNYAVKYGHFVIFSCNCTYEVDACTKEKGRKQDQRPSDYFSDT